MKSKSHERLIIFIIGFLIILCFFLGALLFHQSYEDSFCKIERNYYRDQMTAFCKISEVSYSEKYPSMYPCEKWFVNEGEKE